MAISSCPYNKEREAKTPNNRFRRVIKFGICVRIQIGLG